jgi:hypothetical protein
MHHLPHPMAIGFYGLYHCKAWGTVNHTLTEHYPSLGLLLSAWIHQGKLSVPQFLCLETGKMIFVLPASWGGRRIKQDDRVNKKHFICLKWYLLSLLQKNFAFGLIASLAWFWFELSIVVMTKLNACTELWVCASGYMISFDPHIRITCFVTWVLLSLQLAFHIRGFHIPGFNQPWIENTWKNCICAKYAQTSFLIIIP